MANRPIRMCVNVSRFAMLFEHVYGSRNIACWTALLSGAYSPTRTPNELEITDMIMVHWKRSRLAVATVGICNIIKLSISEWFLSMETLCRGSWLGGVTNWLHFWATRAILCGSNTALMYRTAAVSWTWTRYHTLQHSEWTALSSDETWKTS